MQHEIFSGAIMTKSKRKKSKRTTQHKTMHSCPREKGRNVLIMCAISILMLVGTYVSIRSQVASTGYAHTDIRLIGIELIIIVITSYMFFSWWRSR